MARDKAELWIIGKTMVCALEGIMGRRVIVGMRADGLLVQPYDLLMLFTEDDTTEDGS